MTAHAEQILREIATLPEGQTVSARELLHLGTRAAIDQALSRLAAAGKLMRVARGLYVLPKTSRFGASAPSPAKVVGAFALRTGEIILRHGAAAANALGLTDQISSGSVFITAGSARRLTLGKQSVDIQHAPAWQFALGDRPAGDALRALAWLGPKHARAAIGLLRERLPRLEQRALTEARGKLPTWLATEVSALVENV
jgi:hypothetical protein